jgi:hypothetical protein
MAFTLDVLVLISWTLVSAADVTVHRSNPYVHDIAVAYTIEQS